MASSDVRNRTTAHFFGTALGTGLVALVVKSPMIAAIFRFADGTA